MWNTLCQNSETDQLRKNFEIWSGERVHVFDDVAGVIIREILPVMIEETSRVAFV